MPLPNQQITDDNYRYAFQGQEKDPETGMEAFELRLWDGRLGRWLTVDPYRQFYSPYIGMGNLPTLAIDIDGGRIIVGILVNGLIIKYEYKNGDFYDLVTGDKLTSAPTDFHLQVDAALSKIESKPYGKSFINLL